MSLGLVAAMPAHATDFTFNFTDPNYGSGSNKQTASVSDSVVDSGSSFATASFTRTVSGNALTLQLSAWSIDTSPNPDKTYNAVMQFWSGGIGVLNDYETNSNRYDGETNASPDHAIDNDNGNIDFLVLQFSKPVNLSSIKIGWISGDSDATIGAGDAQGAWNVLPLLDGKSITSANGLNSMLTGTLQAPGGKMPNGTNLVSRATPNGALSDFWVISAANPNVLEGGNYKADYFKLAGIVVSEYPPLPEPGTWVTMILGFGAVGGMMRRRRKSAAGSEKLAFH